MCGWKPTISLIPPPTPHSRPVSLVPGNKLHSYAETATRQVNNAGRFMTEDGPVSKPTSLLPALDGQYALSVRSPYILVHELLDRLLRNKGT